MRPFIVGTAGHIDHGKSALVQALTGMHPDRLPEERRRGITIDLGFTHGVLDGLPAAFVDVPGHERFVRTMVAGAHGVDVVLFVVALDEGVMPQTREHADICRLLGVSQTVVALTKDDLSPGLDAEWPTLVEEEIRSLGEPLSSAPVVRVSARTGSGLDTLKQRLGAAARALPERQVDVPPLLPIDRVFTLKGHGTVVTGTLISGELSAGSEIELVMPAPRAALVASSLRARTIQVHGQPVATATAGQRVAVNLPGLEVDAVVRGGALAASGTGAIRQGALLDVELESVPSAPYLPNRSRLTLHLGTAQALATVDLLGLGELAPGHKAVAQLRLDRALPGLRDQRFVLRGFRPLAHGGHTIAGGRLLWLDRRRRRATDRSFVTALSGDPIPAILRDAGTRGHDPTALRLALNGLPAKGAWTVADGVMFDPAALQSLGDELRTLVRDRGEIPREEARTVLGAGVHPAAFSLAVAALGPGFVVGDTLATAAAPRNPLEDAVERALDGAGLTPPTTVELAAAFKADKHAIGGVLRALAKAGKAIRLTDDLFIHARPAADFRRRATAALESHGSLTTLELKEIAGTSRKFAIPLCEWLDREHVTLRAGDRRTLRQAVRRSGP